MQFRHNRKVKEEHKEKIYIKTNTNKGKITSYAEQVQFKKLDYPPHKIVEEKDPSHRSRILAIKKVEMIHLMIFRQPFVPVLSPI